MQRLLSPAFVALFISAVAAHPHPEKDEGCPPLHRGSFDVHQYQLYPENADWDAAACLVYFGALWNATVAIYDPYKDEMKNILEFPGITRDGIQHIGGVGWDQYTGLVSILVDSAPPWATNGADVSGDNLIMKYDPKTNSILWNLNITAVSKGLYGGFQDVEHDPEGHTYIVGTFPGTIMRVDPEGKAVTPWYLPPTINHTKAGYGGLAGVGHTLLANDADGQIYRFDMLADKGTPVLVPMTPQVLYDDQDAIYLPPKYNGTVLLVSSHASGIQVLRSNDTWLSCEYLGTIPSPQNAETNGSIVTASVQMGSNSIYIIDEWLGDPWVAGEVAGNRTIFPMPDITDQIAKLVGW